MLYFANIEIIEIKNKELLINAIRKEEPLQNHFCSNQGNLRMVQSTSFVEMGWYKFLSCMIFLTFLRHDAPYMSAQAHKTKQSKPG